MGRFMCCVANPSTSGPVLTLSLALRLWRPYGRQRLCNHSANLGVTADFVLDRV